MRRFEWDPAKNAANIRKHRVSFDEAQDVFEDPFAMVSSDDEHSPTEDRQKILGSSGRLRVLLVVYVERDQNVIRLISARRANRTEQRRYEENLPPSP